MDELDRKIIMILLQDARQSLQEIARKAGVSKATVGNRLRELEKNVLIGYRARVNFSLLSMDDVILGLDIMPEKYLEAIDRISSLDFVVELYLTSGDHVAIARVVDDKNRIQESIGKIASIDGVRKIYPAFVQKIVK